MDWGNFLLELIIELGGLTGITTIILKCFGNTIADRLSKRYDFKLNKELEQYKNVIENKSYVSKTKFNLSFSICCEISEKLISCFDAISTITPDGNHELDAKMESSILETMINDLEKITNRNMPILCIELYDELSDVINIFRSQIFAYKTLVDSTENVDINYMSIEDLNQKKDSMCDLLRRYYNNLEVRPN